MPRPSPRALPALQQLLRERFPTATRGRNEPLATGIPALDAAGAGGLPRPGLAELVCSAPSGGGQLVLGQLLAATRAQGLRAALVDAGDAFDPDSWPAPVLEHLVWVRARHPAEALAAADLLLRDANLGFVALDLRDTPAADLRRLPASTWYRLQRALEPTTLAALVLSPHPLVASAQLRLELTRPHGLPDLAAARPDPTTALAPTLLRRRHAQPFAVAS